MRDTYWFLAFYTFLIVGGLVFVAVPVVLLIAGILMGLSAVYFGFNIAYADLLLASGTFSWKHWWFFLIFSFCMSFVMVSFTHFARKTSMYRKVGK